MTPTQRTLQYFKAQNYDCNIVERWLPNPKHPAGGVRKDMFGFADIVALGENSIIAIQSCGQAYSEHHKKITQDPYVAPKALKWLKCGRIQLVSWRKVKLKRGGKAMRWSPRIKEYTEEDFVK